MSKNTYYVYIHRKLATGIPFYVGKGKDHRATSFDKSGKRNSFWIRTKEKYGVIVEIIASDLSEEKAFELEKQYIFLLRYFGIKLTNMTDGGDGVSGVEYSDEYRKRMSDSLLKIHENKKKNIVIKRPRSFGINNHFSDKNLYYFTRLGDGFIVNTTRSELCRDYSVGRDQIKKLFYKDPLKKRKSANGWRLSTPEEIIEYNRKKETSEG